MGVETKIEWCHHSWSPWIGCSKVSTGCKFCYAEEMMDHRYGRAKWDDDGTRSVTSDSYWRQPIRWDREAREAGERRRVFPSLCDPFEDRPELSPHRDRLWRLILETPSLDWLLLTKRPEDADRWLLDNVYGPAEFGDRTMAGVGGGLVPNVWLGASVEDQQRADERIPALLEIPAAVRFLSVEPLLGPIDLTPYLESTWCPDADPDGPGWTSPSVDWVIVGGESGPHARPCDLAWVRSIVGQCRAAGVPVFVKQLGAKPFDSEAASHIPGVDRLMTADEARRPENLELLGRTLEAMWVHLRDRKGGDPSEWPEDLRVREMPKARTA